MHFLHPLLPTSLSLRPFIFPFSNHIFLSSPLFLIVPFFSTSPILSRSPSSSRFLLPFPALPFPFPSLPSPPPRRSRAGAKQRGQRVGYHPTTLGGPGNAGPRCFSLASCRRRHYRDPGLLPPLQPHLLARWVSREAPRLRGR